MTRDRTTTAPLTVYGVNAVMELLRSGEPVRRVYLSRGPRAGELASSARRRGVAVEDAPRAVLERLAGSVHHQGAVAVAPPFRYAPLERLLADGCASALVLDGVQDPRNLGAILRTARAAGVGGVVLPRDRSVGVTGVVASTAAGLLFGLPIALVPNLVRAMQALKDGGFWLVGLVPDGRQSIFDLPSAPRPALVLGGEGEGIRPLVRRTCDFTVSLPMAAGVDSLNVAVAAGVALYELLVRRGPV